MEVTLQTHALTNVCCIRSSFYEAELQYLKANLDIRNRKTVLFGFPAELYDSGHYEVQASRILFLLASSWVINLKYSYHIGYKEENGVIISDLNPITDRMYICYVCFLQHLSSPLTPILTKHIPPSFNNNNTHIYLIS